MNAKIDTPNTMRRTPSDTNPGKSRSSGNAFKHGLSVRARLTPSTSAELENLTQAIVGEHASETLRMAARDLAEAELDYRRIGQHKVALINAETNTIVAMVPELNRVSKAEGDLLATAWATIRVLPILATLERYERRSWRRLQRAFARYTLAAGQ